MLDPPLTVWWDEDPTKTREVVALCRICYPDGDETDDVYLVSPQGVAHHASAETTDCGHDATGAEWWWKV